MGVGKSCLVPENTLCEQYDLNHLVQENDPSGSLCGRTLERIKVGTSVDLVLAGGPVPVR